jgi:hypothetical protein
LASSFQLCLPFPNALFLWGVQTNILCAFISNISTTFSAHLLRLNFITETILCEDYKKWNSYIYVIFSLTFLFLNLKYSLQTRKG